MKEKKIWFTIREISRTTETFESFKRAFNELSNLKTGIAALYVFAASGVSVVGILANAIVKSTCAKEPDEATIAAIQAAGGNCPCISIDQAKVLGYWQSKTNVVFIRVLIMAIMHFMALLLQEGLGCCFIELQKLKVFANHRYQQMLTT